MAEEFIIAGWFDYGPHRDTVLEHFTVCAEASRRETGCLDYVASADPSDAGRVVVFERWESEPDLVAHFDTAHVADFRAAIAPFPRVGGDVRRYFVARSEQFRSSALARG